ERGRRDVCDAIPHRIRCFAALERNERAFIGESDSESLGIPRQAQLRRRSHVADERRRRDHGRAREIALAADAHAVLPVSIEAGDRALARRERVGTLAEAGSAPGLADLAADRTEDLGDRLAREARIGRLDALLDAARAGEDRERLRGLPESLAARGLE